MIHDLILDIQSKSSLSRQESIWLLEHITKRSYSAMLCDFQLSVQQQSDLDLALEQISKQHKPLAYIIGWVPFCGLKIRVKAPILIARPETEEWVAQLIEEIKPYQHQIRTILDIGAGSGVIALTLAKTLPQAQIYALDINPQAIELATLNAKLNNVENITFVLSNLFENIDTSMKFDLIVSNPAYIPENQQKNLDLSVLHWEDAGALFSGPLGLTMIEHIFAQATTYLKHDAKIPHQLIMEIDTTHGNVISLLAEQYGFDCQVRKDLFGNFRTAWCLKK